MKLHHWLHRLAQPLFPATCILCGAAGEEDRDLCSECLADLPWLGACCQLCAQPLYQEGICGTCLQRPPLFDRCISPLLYQGPVPALITGLKFHGRLANARLLAWLMLQRLRQEEDAPELILPVPLHPQRLRERGYNQAVEIARPLAQQLGMALSLNDCIRQRATSPQTALPEPQRRSNLRHAFALKRPLGLSHLALLDDVLTTGSTANELARLLKQSGVARVDVWVVARTP
jgi:ComF family protein